MRCGTALASALLAGCRIGGSIEPIPLQGPMPDAIAVWPLVAGADDRDTAPALLAGLDRAAVRRGYRVVTSEVAREMGFAGHAPGAEGPKGDLSAIGQRLDVDAILAIEVVRFTADGSPLRAASWDLRWVLHSTRGGGLLWSFAHSGSWQRPRDDVDPLRPLDAEPEVAWIGGDRSPSFHDVNELSWWLSRHAMEHLPPHPR